MLTARAMAAAIVLSAPYAQQAFAEIARRWPTQSQTVALAAIVVPALLALVFAAWRIRANSWRRYLLVVAGMGIGVAYYLTVRPLLTEAFHFVEYGILGLLFARAWRHVRDWSSLVLPLLAATIAGAIDEWYQWFIPVRSGELRDIGMNCVAAVGGVLFSAGVAPASLGPPGSSSKAALVRWSAAAVVAVAAFFQVVHVGHDVVDSEIGVFRSRFSRVELEEAARDRASRWRSMPPVSQRRVSREDQYLSEALWHVRQRNQFWDAGDVAAAWRENRILEKFYAPVLEVPTYADPDGHRWTAQQRLDAHMRASPPSPAISEAYPYNLYVWSDLIDW